MSVRSWFRALFAGPEHISGNGDNAAEVAADLGEEYGTSAGGATESRHIVTTGAAGGLGAQEAAEAGADDLESEEAPPDLDP